MKQLKINYSRSLNPSPSQIRAGFLQQGLETYNKDRRLSFLPQITHADYTQLRYGLSVHSYLTKKIDRLSYYKLFAHYNNNTRL